MIIGPFGCTGNASDGSQDDAVKVTQDIAAQDTTIKGATVDIGVDVLKDASDDSLHDGLVVTELDDAADGGTDAGQDTSMAVTKDCFTKTDGQKWCCESSKEVTDFCYPKPTPIWLDAGAAASGGCGAGKFKSINKPCKLANCNTVNNEISMLLGPGSKPSTITCKSDDDCTIVNVNTSCQSPCPLAVRKDAKAYYQQKTKDVDAQFCVAFSVVKKCGITSQPGCPKKLVPGCIKGYCQPFKQPPTNDCDLPKPAGATCYAKKWKCDKSDYVLPPKADACTKNSCANLKAVLKPLLLSQIGDADRACLNAFDCTIWSPGGFCAPFCPIALNKKKVYGVAVLESNYESFCKIYIHGTCSETSPVCITNPNVDCVDKQCVVVP